MRVQWLPETQGEIVLALVLILCILGLALRIVRVAARNKRVDDYQAWRIESRREIAEEMRKIYEHRDGEGR